MMYISIDVGTTNLKMTLIDDEYQVYDQVSYRYTQIRMTQTDFEMNMEEIWQAIVNGINQLVNRHGQGRKYDLILTTAMHSVVLLDDALIPTSVVYAWNDSRGSEEIEKLSQEERTQQYIRTGTPTHSMNPYFKLKYWLNNQDDAKIGSIKDILFYRLTGEWLVDEASASASGLYNLSSQEWDQHSLMQLNISEKQLPVIKASTSYCQVKTEAVLLSSESKVYLGTTDGVASNYACRSLKDSAVLTIGTSHAVRVMSSKPSVDSLTQNFCYHIQDQEYLVGYPSNNGGNVIEWIVDNYATTFEHLGNIAQQDLEPESVFLPFLNGERSPIWNDNAMAELIGMHRGLKRDDLLFSMLCGTIFNMRENIDNLAKQADFSKLCLVGGIVNNSGFVQLISDITGLVIYVPVDRDAERLGSLALVKGEEVKLAYEEIKPNDARHSKLEPYYQKYLVKVADRYKS